MSAPDMSFERWELAQRRAAAIERSTDLAERWATTGDPEMEDPAAEQARLHTEIGYLSDVDTLLGALDEARGTGDAALVDALERQRVVYDQAYAEQLAAHDQAADATGRAERRGQALDAAYRDQELLALARRQEAGYLDPHEFYSGLLSGDDIEARLTETVRADPDAFRSTPFADRLHPDQQTPAPLPPDPEHEQVAWDQLAATEAPTRGELRGVLDGPEPWDTPVGVPDHEAAEPEAAEIGDDEEPEP